MKFVIFKNIFDPCFFYVKGGENYPQSWEHILSIITEIIEQILYKLMKLVLSNDEFNGVLNLKIFRLNNIT